MGTKERILAIRLAEKIRRAPDAAARLGIEIGIREKAAGPEYHKNRVR